MNRIFLMLVMATWAGSAQGESPASDPSGTVRIVGDEYTAGVVQRWQSDLATRQPGLKIVAALGGSAPGLAAIYTGQADVALIDRPITIGENDAFTFIFKYAPTEIPVMIGSLAATGKAAAPVFFVHQANPLERLSLAQADAIFSAERRRKHAPIRNWGDLGLTGGWAAHPIRVYCPDLDSVPGRILTHRIVQDSSRLNWDIITEFSDVKRTADGFAADAGEQVLDALAGDSYGLAVSTLRYLRPGVKPLALAENDPDPAVVATRETLSDQTYPLALEVHAVVNQPPGKSLPPALAEFLHYVQAPEGQAAVQSEGDFLPRRAALSRAP